ncbi:ribbon-helix-helix domain-containing protein [Rhodococcus fascians]|uniref:ribbon-helix-helix domain-containing protein n=1 Tax=Rhodococcoides fascians TaxID=1828 RepID=UPI0024B6F35F|nr:ribbon-helix-helix domain-containing protein [Rhodococcus fascians]MDJ0005469.1 ribbon-helix-helix domain-containing protein [Rhodococcus fascians]
MAAKTVGIALAPELRPALDEVVEHFGHGNRSEFLRVAIRDYQGRLRLERLHALRETARAERGGRRYSTDEVLALIRQSPAAR